MKNESREKVRKITTGLWKYFMELSAIIIGVLVSFYISSSIEKRKDMNDLKFYMTMIKTELKDNQRVISEHIDYYENSLKFRDVLLSTPYKKIPLDSIQKYQEYVFTDRDYETSDYAWEIFKSSGKMDLIPDKTLLLNIMMCYKNMDILRSTTKYNQETKVDLLIKVLNLAKDDPSKMFNPDYKEVRDLFDYIKTIVTTRTGEYNGSLTCKNRLEELILMMDQY